MAVFVDALNVAYWCGAPPSLRFPLTLLAALLDRGFDATLVFDANASYQFRHEAEMYRRMLGWSGHVIVAASGVPADRVLLRRATSCGGSIISRDRYRDHRRRHRKLIDDPGRRFSGCVAGDGLTIEALGLAVSLAETAGTAVSMVESRLDQLGIESSASTDR